MAKSNKKRLFSGMGYREVQRSNSNRRKQLPKREQRWLQVNGYRNVGWDNVIRLYQKINDFLASLDSDEPTLEELFLKADRIGSKYQTPAERAAFDQALRSEVEDIAAEVDRQFPDSEYEFADYSQPSRPSRRRKRHP